jgi:hypothetical protein
MFKLLFLTIIYYIQARNVIKETFENNRHFQLQSINNFTCIPNAPSNPECSYKGVCTKDGKDCVCTIGYASTREGVFKCDYEQKKALTAFLLEFFFGYLGAGYFYLGIINYGVGQLLLTVLGCIPMCIVMCCAFAGENKTDLSASLFTCCVGILGCLWFCGILGWDIYVLVTIGTCSINDAYGMPMVCM